MCINFSTHFYTKSQTWQCPSRGTGSTVSATGAFDTHLSRDSTCRFCECTGFMLRVADASLEPSGDQATARTQFKWPGQRSRLRPWKPLKASVRSPRGDDHGDMSFLPGEGNWVTSIYLLFASKDGKPDKCFWHIAMITLSHFILEPLDPPLSTNPSSPSPNNPLSSLSPPLQVCFGNSVLRSQSLTVESPLPLANFVESGEKATQSTASNSWSNQHHPVEWCKILWLWPRWGRKNMGKSLEINVHLDMAAEGRSAARDRSNSKDGQGVVGDI